MFTVNDLISQARESLPIDLFPEREEEIIRIIYHIFTIERHEILKKDSQEALLFQVENWHHIVSQRQTMKPLAYILGYTYFYQDCFPVSEKTLIPRYDTEHLIECVRNYYSMNSPNTIFDIGTGTGAIALSLHRLFPESKIVGLDLFTEPFHASCQHLNILSDNVFIKQIDFLDRNEWKRLSSVDCIVSNPPYLDDADMKNLHPQVHDFEPKEALYGGPDGLNFYRAIADFSSEYLISGGIVVLEVDHKYKEVLHLFEDNMFIKRDIINDYNNLPRVVLIVKK